MALDDVRTVGEQVDGQKKGGEKEETKEKTLVDTFMETVTTLGTSVRGLCVETGNTLKGCAYPVKERMVKYYDTVLGTFKPKGTRNNHSYRNVSRFGTESSVTSKSTNS